MREYRKPPTVYTKNGRFFVDRPALLAELAAQLDDAPAAPIVLQGPPGSGKTAVLHQIAAGRLGPAYLPILLNAGSLSAAAPADFWYTVAQAAAAALAGQGHAPAAFERAEFAAAPYAAFEACVLAPLRAQTAIPLFLYDNADDLLERMAGQEEPDVDWARFLELPDAGCLLAVSQGAAPVGRVPHAQARALTLEPFTAEETAAFVRHAVMKTVPRDVSNYLHALSGGYPGRLDRVCAALEAQRQAQGWRQLTVADAAAAQRAISPADGAAPALRPYSLPAKRARAGPRLSLLIAGALLALVLILTPLVWNGRHGRGALGWLGPEPTATITATATTQAVVPANPSATPVTPTVTAAPSATPPASPTAPASPTSTATATPSATPSKVPGALLAFTREIDGMPMQRIPAGTFIMGSAEDDYAAAPDERPQHRVTLDAFYIDQFEVNVAQYAAFLNQIGSPWNGCSGFDCAYPRVLAGYTSYLLEEDLGDGRMQYVAQAGYNSYPANHVSWYGADAYCRRVGARLPTEAEWEYAARGADGRLYPWGNEPPDATRAVFASPSYDDLRPVNALPEGASPFGVYGMAGSVWEWTADWYAEDAYTRGDSKNPTGPETGLTRVIRGGAWPANNQADRIRAANRNSLIPAFYSATVGFRCAHDG
jgi:formylglycine-generating enzyme required for sulfatase activity